MDFSKVITSSTAAAAIVPKLTSIQKKALLYGDGDYFQKWEGWIGPQVSNDAKDRQVLMNEVERSFVPKPLIGEVEQRHRNGVAGKEPAFEFVAARATEKDEEVLEGYEKIRQMLKERANRIAGPAPSTNPLPQPEPDNSATNALADASEQLEIENILAGMADALDIDTGEDDFEIPGNFPEAYKKVIEQAKEIKRTRASESKFIAEVNAGFGEWWDRRKGHEIVKEFLQQLNTTGRAAMRFYVPSGLLDEKGEITDREWLKALDKIYLEVPKPESAYVDEDMRTRRSVSVFTYKDLDDNNKEVSRTELTYLDDEGVKTVIRILEGDEIAGEVAHDCAGQLFVDVAELDPLISEAVQRNQNALNVINTMLLLNGNLAGNRERNYINLQQPTVEVNDPLAPNKKRRDPVSLVTGPRAVNFLVGVPVKNGDKTEPADGSIVITDPVSPAPLVEAIKQFETNIYGAVDQLHVQINGDATTSAVARVQARHEHIKRLQGTAIKLEGVLRSRMLGIVALAMTLAQETSKLEQLKKLRAVVTCNIDAGPLTPEERQAIIAEYDKGIHSLETAQMLLGKEDIDAERKKLAAEREGSMAMLKQQAEVMAALVAAGASVGAAAEVAGFSPEQVARLEDSGFIESNTDADNDSATNTPTREGVSGSALSAGIEAENTLNGAQIRAAVDVINALTGSGDEDVIVPAVAVELLTAVGIPRETAQRMVNDTMAGQS